MKGFDDMVTEAVDKVIPYTRLSGRIQDTDSLGNPEKHICAICGSIQKPQR